MTFKQGKFYENGEAIPLQFGNNEQITMMEQMKSMKEEGSVFIGPVFKCFCGAVHEKFFIEDKKWICECGAKYQFFYYDNLYDDIPCIKML